MKRAVLSVALLLLTVPAARSAPPLRGDPVLESLLAAVEVEKRALAEEVEDLERIVSRMSRGDGRGNQVAGQLAQQLRDGSLDRNAIESAVETVAEAEAKRIADGELRAQILSRIVAKTRRLRSLREEVTRRRTSLRVTDPLTGRWDVQINPGPRRGVYRLVLEGTIVSGDYTLDGNFRGSVRGTLIGDKVTLQRIDSTHGFDATFYGRLTVNPTRKLIGSWEATQLAPATGPVAGTWVGHYVSEDLDGERN